MLTISSWIGAIFCTPFGRLWNNPGLDVAPDPLICIGILRGPWTRHPEVSPSMGGVPVLCSYVPVDFCTISAVVLFLWLHIYPQHFLFEWLLIWGGGGGQFIYPLPQFHLFPWFWWCSLYQVFFVTFSATLNMSSPVLHCPVVDLMSFMSIYLVFAPFYRYPQCWYDIMFYVTMLFVVTFVKSNGPWSLTISKSIFIWYHTKPGWLPMCASFFFGHTTIRLTRYTYYLIYWASG